MIKLLDFFTSYDGKIKSLNCCVIIFASPIFTCFIHFIPTIFTEEQMDKKPLVSNYVVSWEIWKFPAAVNHTIDRDFLIIYTGFFSSKPALKNRSTVFTLGNRGEVLTARLEEPIIVPHAQQKSDTKVRKKIHCFLPFITLSWMECLPVKIMV